MTQFNPNQRYNREMIERVFKNTYGLTGSFEDRQLTNLADWVFYLGGITTPEMARGFYTDNRKLTPKQNAMWHSIMGELEDYKIKMITERLSEYQQEALVVAISLSSTK